MKWARPLARSEYPSPNNAGLDVREESKRTRIMIKIDEQGNQLPIACLREEAWVPADIPKDKKPVLAIKDTSLIPFDKATQNELDILSETTQAMDSHASADPPETSTVLATEDEDIEIGEVDEDQVRLMIDKQPAGWTPNESTWNLTEEEYREEVERQMNEEMMTLQQDMQEREADVDVEIGPEDHEQLINIMAREENNKTIGVH